MGFGFALVVLFWVGATTLMLQERQALRAQGARDAENFASTVQRNVEETVTALDRTLKFLRWAEKHDNYKPDWPRIIAEERAVDDDRIQTAVLDANGMLISSSRNPIPEKPVDLSDRLHFKAQQSSPTDDLYIGPVVAGRISRRRNVQFSRKRLDPAGHFLGTVVASLPADYFDLRFRALDLGPGGGLALVGDDGIVRAGSGRFQDSIDKTVADLGLTSTVDFISRRRVENYPLQVISYLPADAVNQRWRVSFAFYLMVALLASAIALSVTLVVARRRYKFEQDILQLSRHDALTGLPNRLFLLERLEPLCAAAATESFALHLIDLDRFKSVNDSYGHSAGDELLRTVADRLRALIGPRDMAARLGGDEFAVLQYVTDFDVEAPALADRICRTLCAPIATSRASVIIGATIGIAMGGRDGAGALELMKAADLALYSRKSRERGGSAVYHPALADGVMRRLQIETAIRSALANNEIDVVYQPILSLASNEIRGFEALARLRSTGKLLMPPSEFIPVAEEVGLIAEIGAVVLARACAETAAGPSHFYVCVNASPLQFENANFADAVAAALEVSNLPAHRLHIEITESMLMRDRPEILEQLRAMRAIGVSVSIDDFGTGYSCLSYLEMYPIDTLKIDQRFVRKLDERRDAVATLRAIIDLAASFGMRTIAEGVETPNQLKALREVGCDAAQGYLIGRPGELPHAPPATRDAA